MILALANDNGIELLKFPGGTSLMFQPNDLMRSHQILKAQISLLLSKSGKLRNELDLEPGIIARQVESILSSKKMPKASRDCFVNLFRVLPRIFAKIFHPRDHQERLSGRWPDSIRR
jgi:hypothetical protein